MILILLTFNLVNPVPAKTLRIYATTVFVQ